MGIKIPRYVKLGTTEMVLSKKQRLFFEKHNSRKRWYWRSEGLWGVDYKIVNGRFLVDSPHTDSRTHHLDNQELVPISKEEYEKVRRSNGY